MACVGSSPCASDAENGRRNARRSIGNRLAEGLQDASFHGYFMLHGSPGRLDDDPELACNLEDALSRRAGFPIAAEGALGVLFCSQRPIVNIFCFPLFVLWRARGEPGESPGRAGLSERPAAGTTGH